MVWRTTLSSGARTKVETALVRDVVEPDLRARGALKKGEGMRVAFVNIDNATGVSNLDALVATLRYNGRSVADNGEDFRRIQVRDGAPDESELARVVPQLVAYRPHVIMSAVDFALVPAVEAAWPSDAPRPRYVSGAPSHGVPASATSRILSVDSEAGAASTKFELRYGAVFDPAEVKTETVTGGPYDAFYALAYAIVALGDEPITGPALARALARLSGGALHVDVGPAGIFAATTALARGDAVDLQGTTTSLDFDPATGDATVDFAITCPKIGRDGAQSTPSGLTWDARDEKVTGALACK
jgi:hypothetical protein